MSDDGYYMTKIQSILQFTLPRINNYFHGNYSAYGIIGENSKHESLQKNTS
jgi:hypothetical protein